MCSNPASLMTFADHVGLTERYLVALLRDFAGDGEAHLVEHHDDRVVVTGGGDDEALGVVGRRGHHHLQPRNVTDPGLQALRMLSGQTGARAGHGEHRHRQGGPPAEHVAHLGQLIGHFVHALAEEVHEHEIDDGPAAGGRGAHAEADDPFLGDGRVVDPVGSELFEQPLVVTVNAACAGDVLTGYEGIGLFPHYRPYAVGDRHHVRQDSCFCSCFRHVRLLVSGAGCARCVNVVQKGFRIRHG